MDELKLVRELRADTPAAAPEDLERARDRLLAQAATAAGRPRRRARLGWRLAVAGGLSVAVTAALLVAQNLGIGDRPPGPSAEAAEVLHRAARAAAAEPAPRVRGDQFVYVESTTTHLTVSVRDGRAERWLQRSHRRAWLSVDGSRAGLLRERLLPPLALPGETLPAEARAEPTGDWQDTPLEPVPDSTPDMLPYASELPTEPDQMLEYVYANSHGDNPRHQQAWITVGDLLRERLLPPEARAALFEAAARIPGVTVVHDSVDAAGRHGLAVAVVNDGVRQELIFHPRTYRLLGERGVVVDAAAADAPQGAVIAWTAQLRQAVVDQAGTAPPGPGPGG
jgi:hypothetical protein